MLSFLIKQFYILFNCLLDWLHPVRISFNAISLPNKKILHTFIQVNLFASTNPQYDDRLSIELQVQGMKIPSSNLGKTCSVQKLLLTFRTIFVHTRHVLPMFCNKRASAKDLPVQKNIFFTFILC